MPTTLAGRLSAVAPSATLAMAAQAAELTARGIKVYPFSVGEPDFPTPGHVVAAAKEALDRGATRYTAVTGTADLKAAIVEATKKYRGHTIEPKQITVSVGAKHALFNLACALYEPGDEVVIPAPYWVSYPEQVRLVGATPVIAETREDEGFVLSPAELEKRVTPKTKALILCTPSNPTGAAYSKEQLLGLVEVMKKGDYYVIVDEIYGDLVYGGFEHHSLARIAPELGERLIIIDGVSKTYAMTGWRIGWSITSPRVASALATVQGQSTTNPAAVAQAAAVAALRGPRESVETMRKKFEARRTLMVEALRSVPGVKCRMPEGAFYAFADVRALYGLYDGDKTLENDEQVAMWLLREAHAATVAGTPFGAPGYLRFSYACSEDDIKDGVAAFARVVQAAGR
jgi:aspartate aminotransferase